MSAIALPISDLIILTRSLRFSDHDPSKVFHRKVNKRFLPTYYDVIKEPVALSTIKACANLNLLSCTSANESLYNRQKYIPSNTRTLRNTFGILHLYDWLMTQG